MNIDLHNIEDLLSISYMESIIENKKAHFNQIKEFIEIVIGAYTEETKNGIYWFSKLISNFSYKQGSSYFPNHGAGNDIYINIPDGKRNEYSHYGIISLNYDLLIENGLNHISNDIGEFYIKDKKENIIKPFFEITKEIDGIGIPMAKLHGSLGGSIVPPTWNKTINTHIMHDWKLASSLLKNATHVIFLGYSLPSTDNYIKYLLASSLNNNRRLKKLSIITMDSDNSTFDRYRSLFSMKSRMHNTNIMNLFDLIRENLDLDFDHFDDLFEKEYMKKKI